MNPTRWFGPSAYGGGFANAGVYIAGPIIGALLAAIVYATFLEDRTQLLVLDHALQGAEPWHL